MSLARRLDRLGLQYAARLERALSALVTGLSDAEIGLLSAGLEGLTDEQLAHIAGGGDPPIGLELKPLGPEGETLAARLHSEALALVAGASQ